MIQKGTGLSRTLASASKHVEIPRDEWDFSKVADAELPFCFEWEYRRSSAKFKQAVKDAVLNRGKQLFDDIDALPYAEFCKWPGIPFSRLDANERRSVINVLAPDSSLSASSNMERLALDRFLYRLRVILRFAQTGGVKRAMLVAKDVLSGAYDRRRGSNTEDTIIRIDLVKSDTFLAKEFHELIRSKRQGRTTRIEETRGAGNSVRQLRTKLKWLGAWRLLEVVPWEEAYVDTQAILGKGLFGNRPELWKRAQHFAELELAGIRGKNKSKRSY